MSNKGFQTALRTLVTDVAYVTSLQSDPSRVTKDFDLTSSELGLLVQVGEAAGAQMPEVTGYGMNCCCCCIMF